ncbi:MAG: alpha/beta hydrolase [Actinomycetota bacterium]
MSFRVARSPDIRVMTGATFTYDPAATAPKSIIVTRCHRAMIRRMAMDVLGPEYTTRILHLGKDEYGPITATLVRHVPSADQMRGAVLWVHGWTDYFFHTHVAEHFADRGFAFYALDLRGHGRSLRPGEPPNYVPQLADYFADFDAAVHLIRADGNRRLVVLAHSTGGLTAALWAHHAGQRKGGQSEVGPDARPSPDVLILNSPWLGFQGTRIKQLSTPSIAAVLARVRPQTILPRRGGVYGDSLLAHRHGEWTFNEEWKPHGGYPVRADWLHAILRGQAAVHRGLTIQVPILVLRGSRSLLNTRTWTPNAMTSDTVLDVGHMSQWAPALGPDVTVTTVNDAMHDVYLSTPDVRAQAFAITDRWLNTQSFRA